jgi:hypothetical protein
MEEERKEEAKEVKRVEEVPQQPKKGKKGIIITCVIVLILLIGMGIIGAMIGIETSQRVLLAEEVTRLSKMNLLTQTIDVEDIKTTGKYAKIEKTMKTYLNQFAESAQKLMELIEDEKLMNMLSAKNYEEDGPEFTKTTAFITEMKDKISNTANEATYYLQENAVNEYAKKQGLTEKEEELYLSLMFDEETKKDLQEVKTQMETQIQNLQDQLTTVQEIIDFLKQNKGKWEIQNNTILFHNYTLLNQYNSLGAKLK